MIVFGSTEFRIEKTEQMSVLRKKLQKLSINVWSKSNKQLGCLYVMDSFDLKTTEEDMGTQYKLQAEPASSNMSPENGKSESPQRKRKMLDLKTLTKMQDCKVGEVFGYKNKMFMKAVFRPIFKSSYHNRKMSVNAG